jgi:serine protease SohB
MWLDYLIFVLEVLTIVVAILIVVAGIAAIKLRNKAPAGNIEITPMHKKLTDLVNKMQQAVLSKDQLSALKKQEKKKETKAKKANKKLSGDDKQKKVYVLDFTGDIKASQVESLRKEVSAVLSVANKKDEVVLRLESPGGMVHGYGLAASQLSRIKAAGVHLTICVDKVAASGGYMMACVADKILAAPFAVVGSIGVVAQIPNFHKLLKKNDVEVELLTAGEYKRTLTMFGENTPKGRQKFIDKLEDTHSLFKQFISDNRTSLDVSQVADGDIWYGSQAIENKLVDAIITSDEYLMALARDHKVYAVTYQRAKSLIEKLTQGTKTAVSDALVSLFNTKTDIL